MPIIDVTPDTFQYALDQATAGTIICLLPGRYPGPYVLSDAHGSFERPIAIEPADPDGKSVRISQGMSATEYRFEANEDARRVQNRHWSPKYPGVHPWIDQARLTIENCSHVQIRGLTFEKSWPTHLFLNECRHIQIADCDFLDGTYCIGADGQGTRNILVDGCTWIQDRKSDRMWLHHTWYSIHGAGEDYPPVSTRKDWRMFDGDFFRSTSIEGGVTIRNCTFRAAFNVIHGYNEADDLRLNRDFHIHNNVFEEIRDNAVEPENAATNWWVHDNIFVNVHKPFSYELQRQQYLYLFSNLFSYTSIQGPDDPGEVYELNRGGGIFKVQKKAKHVRLPHGPSYVFHNSFHTRSDYLRKGVFAGLTHRNNAIECVAQAGETFDRYPRFFGDPDGHMANERFTTEWDRFGITFDHDVVLHPDWPDRIRDDHGYPLGAGCAASAGIFDAPCRNVEGFRPRADSGCIGASGPLAIDLPCGDTWTTDGGADFGAVQIDADDKVHLFKGPKFVSTLDWLD